MKTACVWCSRLVKVADDYDDLQHKAVCSRSGKDAETLFNLYWIEWLFCRYYSDDEVYERMVREQDRYLLPPEQTLRR